MRSMLKLLLTAAVISFVITILMASMHVPVSKKGAALLFHLASFWLVLTFILTFIGFFLMGITLDPSF